MQHLILEIALDPTVSINRFLKEAPDPAVSINPFVVAHDLRAASLDRGPSICASCSATY
jgi:hypothetical protein